MNKLKLRQGFAVGMVHLPETYTCMHSSYSEIRTFIEAAVTDAYVLQESGFDCVMLQNGKDVFAKGQKNNFTVALLAQICGEIRSKLSIPLGISVLKNDAITALSLAKLSDMQFVRCKVYAGAALGGEGIIEGCGGEAVFYRDQIRAENIELWSETYDLSSRPLIEMSFEENIKWCKKMKSDSFIVCGKNHGETLDYCRRARKLTADEKIIIGGGVNLKNMEESAAVADGFIVGSAVEKVPFTGPVSPELAEEFIRNLERIRG